MTQDPRPAPFFIGESPALDVLNSVAMPRSVLYDWLDTPADLLDWLVAAGLAQDHEVAPFRTDPATPELAQAHQDIRAFRERFRAFIEGVSGRELTQADMGHPMIGEINAILMRGTRFLQIEATAEPDATRPLSLADRHPITTPGDLIVRLATVAARLITEANFHYVRNCEGPSCTLYFLDISKNHKRRWCAMEVCGNRAKAAAYRNR
ncbi:CGNR zinc finger domain-containing protein [Tritonibacter sp. SIMBA_163]|uniref:CGNR zinc finger domain-containing protein n=1 Tax=Tritonibacter sp. SIMBA_163 TaxID=3080868 RepID=UPI0039808883